MSGTILVAQPSRTLQTLVRLTLEPAGYAITTAQSGAEALDMALAAPPALLMADARLLGLDGYGLVEAVRASESLRETPVLLMVADFEQPDLDRVTALGIDDILTKPFGREALLDRVTRLLGSPPPTAAVTTPQTNAPDAAMPPAAPATVNPNTARRLEALESRMDELGQAFEDRVAEALSRLTPGALERRIEEAIAKALPDAIARAETKIDPQLEGALKDVARQEVTERLGDRLPEMAREALEHVVWRVVPELAEDLVRAEIARLTEPD